MMTFLKKISLPISCPMKIFSSNSSLQTSLSPFHPSSEVRWLASSCQLHPARLVHIGPGFPSRDSPRSRLSSLSGLSHAPRFYRTFPGFSARSTISTGIPSTTAYARPHPAHTIAFASMRNAHRHAGQANSSAHSFSPFKLSGLSSACMASRAIESSLPVHRRDERPCAANGSQTRVRSCRSSPPSQTRVLREYRCRSRYHSTSRAR